MTHKPPSVLIVEDDDDVRESIGEFLADEGYAVTGARHGAEALEWLHNNPAPRLILLDVMMPVMNGLAFRDAQLLDRSLAEIPVIVVSAVERLEDSLKGLPQVRKPFDLDELLSSVAGVC